MSEQGQPSITPSQIQVRQVTHYQWSWTERGNGEPGVWTNQLVLDEGVEEYIIQPDEDDAELLNDMLISAERVFFDTERKVLMFGVRSVG